MDIQKIEYKTLLVTTPVPRDYPAKHLGKNTDKVLLYHDFIVSVTVDNKTIVITVPKGYATDGSSIPKFFHRIYHPFVTEARWASVVHDYIYSHLHYKFSKDFADILFKEMIRNDNGGWFMRNAFYNAVKLNFNGGGWS